MGFQKCLVQNGPLAPSGRGPQFGLFLKKLSSVGRNLLVIGQTGKPVDANAESFGECNWFVVIAWTVTIFEMANRCSSDSAWNPGCPPI